MSRALATRRPVTVRRAEPIVVIGAGPYGLALAAHLRLLGIEPRVFGRPMDGWRSHMPAGMRLKSTPRASDIGSVRGYGFNDFRMRHGRAAVGDLYPIPLEEFVAYGEWFQRELVAGVEPEDVVAVHREGGAFRLVLSGGAELTARQVVLANGVQCFANTPDLFRPLAEQGLASHPAHHRDLRVFAGRTVAVIGAGQSALESAALLHECGARPVLVARTRELVFGTMPEANRPGSRAVGARLLRPASALGPGWRLRAYCANPGPFRLLPDAVRAAKVRTVLGPAGAWWLLERVLDAFPVVTGHTVSEARAVDGKAVLGFTACESRLEADHVLVATGYRVDLSRLDFLEPALRGDIERLPTGSPRLGPDFGSSVDGLHFSGLAAAGTFGPLMRFVAGTGFAARRTARALRARV
ncbi:FAD-dependent oxidoreductase [Kitasatospora sp. NPDC004289]